MGECRVVSYCFESEKFLGLTLRDLPHALIGDAVSFKKIIHLSALSCIGEAEIATMIAPLLMSDRDVFVSWRAIEPKKIQIRITGD